MKAWQLIGSRLLVGLRRVERLRPLIGYYKKRRSDVRVEWVAERGPGLRSMPYEAIVEIGKLQLDVRERLPKIRAPLLLLHGAFDHLAPPSASARVSQQVASSRVHRKIMPRSYHHLARDLDRERVASEVHGFLAGLV